MQIKDGHTHACQRLRIASVDGERTWQALSYERSKTDDLQLAYVDPPVEPEVVERQVPRESVHTPGRWERLSPSGDPIDLVGDAGPTLSVRVSVDGEFDDLVVTSGLRRNLGPGGFVRIPLVVRWGVRAGVVAEPQEPVSVESLNDELVRE